MPTLSTSTPRRQSSPKAAVWVVTLGFLGLVFDGYDLVVYGAVLPGFLSDPSQIGAVTPEVGGALGSYALIGVLVGALAAGSVSDAFGRRRLMIGAYAWFALAMGLTSFATTIVAFGWGRFAAGLRIGTLLATTAALVAEYAPPGRKNVYNALSYSGIAVGSTLAALLALLLLDSIGWRGMFLVGALPLVTLFPLALWKLPESRLWQATHDARALGDLPAADSEIQTPVGFVGLFRGRDALAVLLLGLTSVTCLLLVYSLNTWLPELMGRAGFTTKGSLLFLLVLNGSAVVGQLIGSRLADRFGPKPVVSTSFAAGAVAIVLLTAEAPVGLLLLFVAVAGIGTSGTQTLIYGFVANHFRTAVRGAAVAWCAGFGRLGGIGGPLLGGILIGAGIALSNIFYALAAVAVLGAVLTLLVPRKRAEAEQEQCVDVRSFDEVDLAAARSGVPRAADNNR